MIAEALNIEVIMPGGVVSVPFFLSHTPDMRFKPISDVEPETLSCLFSKSRCTALPSMQSCLCDIRPIDLPVNLVPIHLIPV